jgi:DNA-binding NtrC family response regulator
MSQPLPGKKQREKTILVVEEEEGIRNLLQLALSSSGFQVHLTGSGSDALRVYQSKGKSIDLVLMDVRMQGMDGPATFSAIRKLNDQARCCFMTGDTSADREQELLDMGGLHVFRKPFSSLAELVRTLDRFLK